MNEWGKGQVRTVDLGVIGDEELGRFVVWAGQLEEERSLGAVGAFVRAELPRIMATGVVIDEDFGDRFDRFAAGWLD